MIRQAITTADFQVFPEELVVVGIVLAPQEKVLTGGLQQTGLTWHGMVATSGTVMSRFIPGIGGNIRDYLFAD
jgi:hypothetical protein